MNRYETYIESLFVDLSFIDDGKSETDIRYIYDDIESAKTTLIEPAKIVVEKLLVKDRDKRFPDYSGQFLHYISECLLDFIVTNDTEGCRNLFHSYFVNSYKQFYKLLPNSAGLATLTRTLNFI